MGQAVPESPKLTRNRTGPIASDSRRDRLATLPRWRWRTTCKSATRTLRPTQRRRAFRRSKRPQTTLTRNEQTPVFAGVCQPLPSLANSTSTPSGARTPVETKRETYKSHQDDAHSDARGEVDSGLNRLIELWPRLSELDRQALVDHAEHLAALRGGIEAVAGLDDGDASESRLPASDRSGQTTARPVKGKRDAPNHPGELVTG